MSGPTFSCTSKCWRLSSTSTCSFTFGGTGSTSGERWRSGPNGLPGRSRGATRGRRLGRYTVSAGARRQASDVPPRSSRTARGQARAGDRANGLACAHHASNDATTTTEGESNLRPDFKRNTGWQRPRPANRQPQGPQLAAAGKRVIVHAIIHQAPRRADGLPPAATRDKAPRGPSAISKQI